MLRVDDGGTVHEADGGLGLRAREADRRAWARRPFRAAAATRWRHASRGRLPEERGMRVLVAEDEPVVALALVQRLRGLGHEPIGPAADGDQAVALARATDARRLPLRHRAAGPDRPRGCRRARARGARRPLGRHHGRDRPRPHRPLGRERRERLPHEADRRSRAGRGAQARHRAPGASSTRHTARSRTASWSSGPREC